MERHEPELAALADQAELPVAKIDVGPGEGSGFAEAEAGEGEQVEGNVLAFRADRGVNLA